VLPLNLIEVAAIILGDVNVVVRELVEAGVLVRSFATTKVSLEEIFVKVYGDQANGAGE